jgi:hypothetical protein
MNRRWTKPKPGTPQRGLFTPARPTTDTSAAAAASAGLKRGGDMMAVENVGDLANAMVGAMERHTRKTRLRGVMLALTVRKEVLDWMAGNPAGGTADEIATAIKRSFFTVRPRVSELNKMGAIVDSGARRMNASSGRLAIVWRKKG